MMPALTTGSVHSISRRDFLCIGLAASGALLVGFESAAKTARMRAAHTLALWIRIDPDDAVTLLVNATEMGQGAQSGLAQLLAEELGIEWCDVRTEMAPLKPEYFSMWGSYQTGGSGSVRGMFNKLREAGATAKHLLLSAAAARWQVDASACRVHRCTVVHEASGQRASFGSLVQEAAAVAAPAALELTPRQRWRLIGKPMQRTDLLPTTSGKAAFGIDTVLPDMLIASIAQAPIFGSTLLSVDEEPALAISGVRKVVKLENAVAVIASDTWSAQLGLASLNPKWSDPPALPSMQSMRSALQSAAQNATKTHVPADSTEVEWKNAHETAMARSARRIHATYETPFLAHACMEPMNATVHVRDKRATVWVPTQVQSNTQRAIAEALRIPQESVEVITTRLGGGFGRRLEVDYAVQAALIARETDVPVKLIWSRTEDLQHDFYRQLNHAHFEAGLTDENEIAAVRVRLSSVGGCSEGGMAGHPCTLPNTLITTADVRTNIPLGAWRAVMAVPNIFFLESFVDEIAYAIRREPLHLRRELLSGSPRVLRVLEAAVQASGMEQKLRSGHHMGIALGNVFESICVQVVEVSIPQPRCVRVHRVVCALDCGTAVNPDSVRAQVEGGIAMALSAAAFESIDIERGRATQTNFHEYPLLRIPQMPCIDVVLLESPDEGIGGAGEPPLPPLAPALANALFAATGERVRKLPLSAAGWTLI